MSRKKIIMFAMVIGSTIGAYAPTLFGVSAISFTSLICSTIGAIIGVYFGWKVSR